MGLSLREDPMGKLNVPFSRVGGQTAKKGDIQLFQQALIKWEVDRRKSRTSGSVENMEVHENHRVVSQDHQPHVAVLAMVGPTMDIRSLAAFDHGNGGFDLNALDIQFSAEANLHQSTV